MVKNMAIKLQERLYDIDDMSQIICQSDDDTSYELIDGKLITMAPVEHLHGNLAGKIAAWIYMFDPEEKIGKMSVEVGFHPPGDRRTLLAPDVAFIRRERLRLLDLRSWTPFMPDLAVEIKSPSNTPAQLRRKAAIYLRNGAQIVWLVLPAEKSVEVCRLGRDGEIEYEFIGETGSLSGETVLPGFRLQLKKLFA